MSEFNKNSEKRVGELVSFAGGLIRGENGSRLVERYRLLIDTVTAEETMVVLDRLITGGFSVEEVKGATGKIINTFYRSLNAVPAPLPGEGHFLSLLMQENLEAAKIMQELKGIMKDLQPAEGVHLTELYKRFSDLLEKLKLYELHYIKKENILFPYLESTFPDFRCLQVMWAFHDDFRDAVRNLGNMLGTGSPDREALFRETGKLFFVVLPVIFREERIVFPVALKAIPPHEWEEMLRQAFETGWCYINPVRPEPEPIQAQTAQSGLVDLGTGSLTAEQVSLLLNHLPVDITFVDENDEVRYFSAVKDRIFPRSKAIIGRKVQNCHPHDSVHVVNEIVEAFRNGRRDQADFWIRMKGRLVLIRYYAVRDASGAYRGTIEVSQDVTGIKSLEGERRLLDWTE